MNNKIKISGKFHMDVFKLINGEKHLIESYDDNNLVVNTGKWCLVRMISYPWQQVKYIISRIAFGEWTAIPTIHDTLTPFINNGFIKNIIDYEHTSQTEVIFNWELSALEANGMTIAEYGLATTDYLFARVVRTAIQKEADIIIEGKWTIIFI